MIPIPLKTIKISIQYRWGSSYFFGSINKLDLNKIHFHQEFLLKVLTHFLKSFPNRKLSSFIGIWVSVSSMTTVSTSCHQKLVVNLWGQFWVHYSWIHFSSLSRTLCMKFLPSVASAALLSMHVIPLSMPVIKMLKSIHSKMDPLHDTTCHQTPPWHKSSNQNPLSMTIQSIPYPSNCPLFKSISFQFRDKSVILIHLTKALTTFSYWRKPSVGPQS